jgi:hypothetical protein
MKSKPILWFSIIFSLSLAVGLLAGRSVNAAFRSSPPEVIASPSAPVETLPLSAPTEPAPVQAEVLESKALSDGVEPAPPAPETERILKFNQHNLLVVQVDSLRAQQPVLQAIWLAIHVPEMGQVMLLPLYPSIKEVNGPGMNTALEAIAGLPSILDAGGNPHPELLSALQTTGLWWHHTLVLDQVALIELLETAGSQSPPSDSAEETGFDPLQAVSSLAAEKDTPQAYLFLSARLYGQICSVWTLGTNPEANAEEISVISPAHLKTDLNPAQAVVDEEPVVEQAGLHCLFPSLGLMP